jgi:hypothetical protein
MLAELVREGVTSAGIARELRSVAELEKLLSGLVMISVGDGEPGPGGPRQLRSV